MSNHFNNLTPAEHELLALLSEECGEVVQIIGKILRHGLDSMHPADPGTTNRELLQKEMGDVRAAMIFLCEAGITSKLVVHEWADAKRVRVREFLHHARVALPTPAPREQCLNTFGPRCSLYPNCGCGRRDAQPQPEKPA